MRLDDLHILPKFADGWSYLYVEHCRVDREENAIALHDAEGSVAVPCANLALLMVGPGVSLTHAAILVLADHGCLVAWCGEQGVRFYALGMGETRSAARFMHQARLWASDTLHYQVVRRMYQKRFTETLAPFLTLQQIRGLEGRRVRQAYEQASRETGLPWKGRQYDRRHWNQGDLVNRALSTANSCLYGICHAAIVSAGFSPALGFIHTGKMLSFVYDIADLYKTEISVPIAFRAAAQGEDQLERRTRMACRDAFASSQLLARIIPDINQVLAWRTGETDDAPADADPALPGHLWDPEGAEIEGGRQQLLPMNLPLSTPHDHPNP
jgi:CRISPR-associated protein Cas1